MMAALRPAAVSTPMLLPAEFVAIEDVEGRRWALELRPA
jgi:hypothetical protein